MERNFLRCAENLYGGDGARALRDEIFAGLAAAAAPGANAKLKRQFVDGLGAVVDRVADAMVTDTLAQTDNHFRALLVCE